MSRRAPSVSVSERPKGSGKWSVRWREAGKQREERGYESKGLAEERALELRRQLRRGVPSARRTLPVGIVVRDWWASYVEAGETEHGTADTYQRTLSLVFDSGLADEDARALTTADVNVWVREQVEAGASPNNLRNALTALSSAFQRGVEWGELVANPIRGVRRPKTKSSPVEIPDRTDIVRLALAVPEPDAKWRSLLAVAALCGLRQQEQFALRWSSIDERTILVREAVESARRGIKEPKSRRGTRRVPMVPAVRDLLDAWRIQSPRSSGTDLVWSTQIGSAYTRSTFRQRVWVGWREAAGLPELQWKHLRHFYASYAATAGRASMLQVSRWMGHASIRTTDEHYGFLFDEDVDAVLDRMQDGF